MHIDRASDVSKHRDRQASTEVLPEFFEPDKKFVDWIDGGVPERYSDLVQAATNFPRCIGRETINQRRIDAVDRDTNRDRLAVTQFKSRPRL